MSDEAKQIGKVPNAAAVADRLAIMEVVYVHCRGVDRASTEILQSCYWPDADVDYGGYKGNAHAFCESLPGGLKRFANTHHQVSNVVVELDSSDARVETLLTAYHYLPVEDGPDTEMTYLGRYFDHMQKRDGVWKIQFRKIVMTWHQNALASADEEKNPSLQAITRAARYPEDPWFSFKGKDFD